MVDAWKADPAASFVRRLCKPPHGDGVSTTRAECPDIWELDNGDIAVIGKDLTSAFGSRIPDNASIDFDERLVILPRATFISAKANMPDA
ncbi:MAG TPA: hypothetical protein VGR06_35535 [Actinophytocola sp.]|jgi:hypothetical protein|uniref:hypothetical protein n=1 Tax=Actinophytocola sp. TaxID=1872138 RepID=UPI002DFD4ED6|nr:hypothetical protein [Actinophytocola sp.]